MQPPGVEPGSKRWQRSIIAVRPWLHDQKVLLRAIFRLMFGVEYYDKLNTKYNTTPEK